MGVRIIPRAMNLSQSFVQTNVALDLGSWNFRREDGVVSARDVQTCRGGAQSSMQVATRRASGLAGEEATDDRGAQRNSGDQAQPLMNLQHVGPLVKSRLLRCISLNLTCGETQILQRKPRDQSQVHCLVDAC